MFALSFIPLGLAAIFFGIVFFLKNKKTKNIKFKPLYYIFGFALLAIVLVRCIMGDGSAVIIWAEFKLNDPLNTFVRWIVLFGEVILLTFLKNRNKSNCFLASFVALPLMLIGLFNMPFDLNKYYLPGSPTLPESLIFPSWLIWTIFILEFTLSLFLAVLPILEKGKEVLLKDKRDVISTVKIGVLSFFICIPFLTYPGFFGSTTIEMKLFNLAHIGWMLSIFAVTLIIFFVFRNEEKDIRWTIMSVLVFFLFINLNSMIKLAYLSNRFPLQLCNLAAELFVVLLLTEYKPLFRFIYIANPVGALIAIVTLSERLFIFDYFMIHYLVEHLYVFIIPILFRAFGLFERPKFKIVLRDYFILFSMYFALCLFVNTIHNGIILPIAKDNVFINDVNFFYQLECPIPDLTFAKDLMKWKVNMFGQNIYVLYLLFIYVVFSALALAFYWIQLGIGSLVELTKRRLLKKSN